MTAFNFLEFDNSRVSNSGKLYSLRSLSKALLNLKIRFVKKFLLFKGWNVEDQVWTSDNSGKELKTNERMS